MKWLRSQFRTFETIFVGWRDHLTIGGKAITTVLVLCIPALATLDSPLYLLFAAQLSLLAIALAVGYRYRPTLQVRVQAPPEAHVGEWVPIIARLTNHAPRPAFDLTLSLDASPAAVEVVESPQAVPGIAAGEARNESFAIRPLRRGPLTLPDVAATTTFPLGILRRRQLAPSNRNLLVLPSYRPLRTFDDVQLRSRQPGNELQPAAVLGDTGDYIGSREYHPGIAVRRWDYSSWARLGQPVVREFSEPQHPTAAILVDSTVHRLDDSETFEARISLAAALSEALTKAEYRLAILAVGNSVSDLSSHSLVDQHRVALRALALATATTDSGFHVPSPGIDRAVAFVLLNGWDEQRLHLCNSLLERDCQVVRVFLAPDAARGVDLQAGDVVTSTREIEAGGVEIR